MKQYNFYLRILIGISIFQYILEGHSASLNSVEDNEKYKDFYTTRVVDQVARATKNGDGSQSDGQYLVGNRSVTRTPTGSISVKLLRKNEPTPPEWRMPVKVTINESLEDPQFVRTPSLEPWSSYGSLTATYLTDRKYMGSGVLISENIVLTAACNIHLIVPQQTASEVLFYPGREGDKTPWIGKVIDCIIHEGYHRDNPDYQNYNIALLYLDQPLGKKEMAGHLPYQAQSDEYLKTASLRITGYPMSIRVAEIDFGDSKYQYVEQSQNFLGEYAIRNGLYMYSLQSPEKGYLWVIDRYIPAPLPREVTPERILYDIETYPGTAGASIHDENHIIYGIHVYGGTKDDRQKSGIRLTPQMIEWIEKQSDLLESRAGSSLSTKATPPSVKKDVGADIQVP